MIRYNLDPCRLQQHLVIKEKEVLGLQDLLALTDRLYYQSDNLENRIKITRLQQKIENLLGGSKRVTATLHKAMDDMRSFEIKTDRELTSTTAEVIGLFEN